MRRTTRTRAVAIGVALALAAAACGGDDDGGADDPEPPTVTDTDDPPTTDDDPPTTDDDGDEPPATDPAPPAGDRTYGGTVTVGLEAEATGLRPWEDACSSPCYNIMVTIFDKLVETRADGTVGGWLAESFEANDDFTEWTFTLRSGVEFHDGTPLTSQTIVDMFELQQEGATASGTIASSGLENVEAIDELTVLYTLNAPNSAFPANLERAPLGAVFQPEAAAADPAGFSTNPIGTGPFVIQTRDLDNETVVVRNENYWMTDADGNQLPYLDSVVFRPIPDEGTRLDSLLSGTVNAMHTLRQGTIRDARSAAEGNDRYTLLDYQGNNTGGGMFNTAVAPFDDVRVRRGLVTMINQDVYIQALGGEGISEPASQWFSPDSVWYSPAVADVYPSFDPGAGQALLEEYVNDPDRSDGRSPGDPIEFDLGCPPDPTLVAAMQVLEQLWRESGLVEVSLSNLDQQAHINRVLGAPPDFTGEHEAVCWRWGNDNDPSTVLGPAFGPPDEAAAAEVGTGVSATNFPNYWNPDVYQAINDARATDDFDERHALYETVMMALAEEVPVWYSGHTATMFGIETGITGLDSWVLPDGTQGVGFPDVEGRWAQVSIES